MSIQNINVTRILNILNRQPVSYLTKGAWQKFFENENGNNFPYHKPFNFLPEIVIDSPTFSKWLKEQVKEDRELIRHINSKSSTNRLSYADWFNIPGTNNYRQVFHYERHLTPDDKYRIKHARLRIKKNINTFKLTPHYSKDMPIYTVPNHKELWKYKMIFVKPLIEAVKESLNND